MRYISLMLFTVITCAAAEAETAKITGRCHCGKITYEITTKIASAAPCDCRDCQRATGSLKPPYAVVKGDGIKITAGAPKTYKAKSGVKCDKHGSWRFCSDCGTKLFWVAHKGKQTDVLAGTLDDPQQYTTKLKN